MITKVKSVFQIPLIILLAVLMFFMALPPSFVSADTDETLSQYSGSPGDIIEISYTFGSVTNGLAVITFNGIYLGSATITNGSFTYNFQVPVLPRGKYAVTVSVEGSSTSLTEEFTIIPKINISDDEISVGEQITITGNGFSPGNVAIYIDNSSTPLIITTADASGMLNSVIITVPSVNKAIHILKAIDITGNAGAVYTTFSIIPSIILSDVISGAGAQITITGSGFASSSMITVSLNSVVVPTSSIVTDINGTFMATITLSLSITKGNYSITAIDTMGNVAITNLVIRQSISISEESGFVNESITVNGASFDPNKTVSIYFNNTMLTSTQTDSYGSFSIVFSVPVIAKGDYVIRAIDSNSNEATKLFKVESNISITPASDIVGTQINISGCGFAAASNTAIYFDNLNIITVITSSAGAFSIDVLIPHSPGGEHIIKAIDGQNNQSTTSFITIADISLDYNTGAYGDTVIISGTGFAAGSSLTNMVTFTISSTPLIINEGNIFTDAYGSFTASFDIPDIINGVHIIKATDNFGNTGNISITVKPVIISNITTGIAGDELQLSGFGFAPNKKIDIKYNNTIVNTALGTITSSISGSFIASFILPDIDAGTYKIQAGDGTNTAFIDFTHVYETIPPPAVNLISPVDGEKSSQPVLFNWNASSDPSGVFYRLQIATDAAFTTIIVDIDNLTVTNYTMDAEDRLESVNSKNPYYWRVMAVDGVGNTSIWTVDKFVVGFIWPLWLTYVLIGAVVLLFLIIMGVWMGRKIAALRDDKTYNYDMDNDVEYRYREQYPDANLDHSDR
jgi:hypothetical protein